MTHSPALSLALISLRRPHYALFILEKPSNRIAFLHVNKAIGVEAKEASYKSSTFVFNIGCSIGPWAIEFGNSKALRKMQNIEVGLDS